MLCIDKCRRTAQLLGLGNHLQRQRGLAGGFRAVNLDHPAFGKPTNAQRNVQPDRTRRDDVHVPGRGAVAQAHYRAFAELFLDLSEGLCECFFTILIHFSGPFLPPSAAG